MISKFFEKKSSLLILTFKEKINHLSEILQAKLLEVVENPQKKSDIVLLLLNQNLEEELKLLLDIIPQNIPSINFALTQSIKKDELTKLNVLQQLGVDLNQPICLQDPLLTAAFYGSTFCFEYLYKNSNARKIYSPSGYTLMHAAAMGGCTDIILFLLNQEATKDQIFQSDIFGDKPYDIAVGKNLLAAADLLNGGYFSPKTQPVYVDISQEPILAKLQLYLKYKIQSKPNDYLNFTPEYWELYNSWSDAEKISYIKRFIDNIFDKGGLCNGLGFLYGFHFAKTGSPNEFYNIIDNLLSLNDPALNLSKAVTTTVDKFENLDLFLNQFCSNVIWFFHGTPSEVTNAMGYRFGDFKVMGIKNNFERQRDRLFQYSTVMPTNENIKLSKVFDFPTRSITKLQLKEILDYFCIFRNVYLDIAEGHHTCTLYINQSSDIYYYDPSCKRRLEPFQNTTLLAEYIYTYKYYYTNELTSDDRMVIDLRMYSYDPQLYVNSWFLPQMSFTFVENQFNPLHICVLRNDVLALAQQIEESPSSLTQKDIHGYTPLERAIVMNANACAERLLEVIDMSCDYYHLAELAYAHNNLPIFSKLISMYNFDYGKLFLSEYFLYYSNHLIDFYKCLLSVYPSIYFSFKNVEKDCDSGFEMDPLRIATMRGDEELFAILIQCGAEIEILRDDDALFNKAESMLSQSKNNLK